MNDPIELKPRDHYLRRLTAFQDTKPVKVITGIRRCGKSSLMKLMVQHLKETGVSDSQIIGLNFESLQCQGMDYRALYQYVMDKKPSEGTSYLFFDEIQEIRDWQRAINAFRVDLPCDIYITGSNASLLSGELATYLAGRYVEIRMLPLSFREFIDFHGYRLDVQYGASGSTLYRVTDKGGFALTLEALFEQFLLFGGMPGIADIGLDADKAMMLLEGVYASSIARDILERARRRGLRQITDADLLRKISLFLADNIGNTISVSSIGNTLSHEGMLENRSKRPAAQTVQAYVNALTEAYIFYGVKRYDIKGKTYLSTRGKYYIVDIGLRNYLLGLRDADRGHSLENIVYLELLRRGYEVAIGKSYSYEIDFIATNPREKLYIQVTESIASQETKERELRALRQIRDHHEKMILSLDRSYIMSQDGIRLVNLLDWLLLETV